MIATIDQALKKILDFKYADFSDRHVFTTKLRLVIFLGFWALIIAFFPSLLWADQPIMLCVSLTFLVTTICYHFILSEKIPYLLFIIELADDIAAHTILIYVTGGMQSKLYIIYIVYCLSGGLIYNWRVSAVIACLALTFYTGLILVLRFEWLEPFVYQGLAVSWFGRPGYQWFLNLTILAACLGVAVYGNSIATYFSQLRERALEARNRELIALNRVSSMIRSVVSFQRIVNEILRHLTRSLEYAGALVLVVDEPEGKVNVYAEERRLSEEVGDRLGIAVQDLYLPIEDEKNPIYQAAKSHKRILRSELADIIVGVIPRIPPEVARSIQHDYGFRKTISVPLIAERRLVGALVGFSSKEWLTDDDIAAFERYADQAALVLDNAALIERLRSQNIELERVSRVKSDFLATMSHELRTPLTAIIGFSELLLEGVLGELSADQKDSLDEVLGNAENLLQLINSLLDLAKIEAGRMELNVAPVNLGDIADRIQRTVTALLHKKRHQMKVHVQDNLPICYVDERKIQQTLLNLVSNAIKFTDEGGKIAIEVRYYPNIEGIQRWAGVKTRDFREGAFEILVADNGIGIEEKDLQVIFESFRQVDSSFTRNYQGTGLGLALSQQFVQMHHGKMKAESRYGEGTIVGVLLPKGRLPSPT